MIWGSRARMNWDGIYEVMPNLKMLEPDNPSFDHTKEVINFIRERVGGEGGDRRGGDSSDFDSGMMLEIRDDGSVIFKMKHAIKVAATGLAALGIAATI